MSALSVCRQDAPFATEIDVTSAVSRIVRGVDAQVCLTAGHGERGQGSSQGMDALLNLWSSNGYNVRSVELLGEVPDLTQCDSIVVLAPQFEFRDEAKAAVLSHLANGRSALIASDPLAGVDLSSLVSHDSLSFERGIVVEADSGSRLSQDLLSPLITRYTDGLDVVSNLGAVYLPGVQAVVVKPSDREGLSTASAAQTSDVSYLERDIGDGEFNLGTDLPGPLTVFATADESQVRPSGEIFRTRILAAGDVDFLSNAHIGDADNARAALAFIDWLNQPEDVSDAASSFPPVRELIMTDARKTTMLYSTAIAPAVLFLLAAALLWVVRRGR